VKRIGAVGRFDGAFRRMVHAIRTDFETQCAFDSRYGAPGADRRSLAKDLVRRVGLQLSAAYRVMRFADEAGVPLAPQVLSRLIRHLYGADIHWKAQIEPGVMVVHGMGLAISHAAHVGRDVLLFQNVTLGAGRHPETREIGAPTVEDGVHIGPGAVIVGPVTIGARSKVMANCVVTTSIPPDSLVEAHAPTVRPRTGGRGAGLETRRLP
jgi:serine O-acetyltransferase